MYFIKTYIYIIIKQLMQSYKLHVVSEHLKDRHPYIEPDFSDRYDPSEVYHAVFDRSIPKLIEILLMPDIEQLKYRDALITLNEMVSHQEMKDDMITQGLVSISSAFLHHRGIEIRREAVLLLGSLVTLKRGREQLISVAFQGFSSMLFDTNLLAREACAWALYRITTARDGVEILCQSNLIKTMINSFMQYTTKPAEEFAKFDIYLLEAFSRVLEYDNGIFFFIRCGIVKRMNEILKDDSFFDQSQRINYLCLDCLAKICANNDGKQEGIEELIIPTASEFLDSPITEESQFSTILIMNCTIHLDGKKQCVHVEEDRIILKLIGLLNIKQLEFKKDLKQTLINISEYPEGFLIITKKLANDNQLLDDLFGSRVVIALANLLPKTSSLVSPPQIPGDKLDEYKVYVLGLCKFLKDYDDALQYAIEDTVKIQERLLPFLAYRQLSDNVAHSLLRLCNADEGCREGTYTYLQLYGDLAINSSKTTLNNEIHSHKKLHDLLQP